MQKKMTSKLPWIIMLIIRINHLRPLITVSFFRNNEIFSPKATAKVSILDGWLEESFSLRWTIRWNLTLKTAFKSKILTLQWIANRGNHTEVYQWVS